VAQTPRTMLPQEVLKPQPSHVPAVGMSFVRGSPAAASDAPARQVRWLTLPQPGHAQARVGRLGPGPAPGAALDAVDKDGDKNGDDDAEVAAAASMMGSWHVEHTVPARKPVPAAAASPSSRPAPLWAATATANARVHAA